MKTLSIAGLLAGLTLAIPHANAQAVLRGSDTLFDVVSDSIAQAGLGADLNYLGGGSGLGETGLRNGTQGIAPMSRALTIAAINDLVNQGVAPIQNVIGLDGVSLFVNTGNTTLDLDIQTIKSIYTCDVTDWSQVPHANGMTGPIAAYRRNDVSGTTDTFKTLVMNVGGTAAFGACVTIVDSTTEIASHTANELGAIGYAGLSGKVAGNKEVPVAATATSRAIAPTIATIREFSYPLARRLYLNAVSGVRDPSPAEQALLDVMTDRSFLDPILEARGFVTCAIDGCP